MKCGGKWRSNHGDGWGIQNGEEKMRGEDNMMNPGEFIAPGSKVLECSGINGLFWQQNRSVSPGGFLCHPHKPGNWLGNILLPQILPVGKWAG